MNKLLRIGRLAKETGLSEKTIRFYESIDLIKRPMRAENGYRVYDQDAVEELQMIKYARDLGIPVEKVKTLMQGCKEKGCEHSKDYLKKEIHNYIESITNRIDGLIQLKSELNLLNKTLSSSDTFCTNGKYCCNILHQLIELKKGGTTYAK